jgi:membrane-bound lytic murein transglycosylase D
MSKSPRVAVPLLLLALLAALPATAARVDKNAPLYQSMDAASARYREARIKLQSGDDTAMATMSRALEDLEDISQRCIRQRGCDTTRVITQYETLLKSADLGPQSDLAGESDWDDSVAEPDHASPILAGSPEAARSLSLLDSNHEFDAMVAVNEPVQAAIKEWLTTQRAFLVDAWENYQYMRYLMYPEYQKAGLPEALLFGIMAKESGGKVHAISRSGASGPLQFMPATASRFGVYRDTSGFDWRFDPQSAARANASYINERFAGLNRNLEYTVAAYNGGEGRAARLYQSTGGASFWSPQVQAQLPAETRDYVPAVIAAAWLFLHPKKYGLDFPRVDTAPGQFTVARQTSINELTICLGNGGSRDGWFRVLRNLNPRYDASATLATGTVLRAPKHVAALYTRNCVQGKRVELAQQLMAAKKAVVPVPVAAADPASTSSPQSAQIADAIARNDQGKRTDDKDSRGKGSQGKNDRKKRGPGVYRVRAGDSLAAIAREHDCDVSTLAKHNKLRSPSYTIKPGQRLKLDGCDG